MPGTIQNVSVPNIRRANKLANTADLNMHLKHAPLMIAAAQAMALIAIATELRRANDIAEAAAQAAAVSEPSTADCIRHYCRMRETNVDVQVGSVQPGATVTGAKIGTLGR